MPYKAFQNPALKFINPNKDSPASFDQTQLKKAAREFKDVSLSFSPHPITKDLTIIRNERAITNSIKNLIMYHFGDVPFQLDIGSNVRGYMFETVDPATALFIENEVKRVITEYEPRAIIDPNYNEFPLRVGEVTSQYSYDNYDNTAKNAGYATVNQYLKETGQGLGVWAEVNDEQNSIELTIIYTIVGYNQIFKVEHILYPTRA